MNSEISAKHEKINQFLTENKLDAAVLSSRANFSWLTAGKLNYVNSASEKGVSTLVVTPEKISCVAKNIESVRMEAEEIGDEDIEIKGFEWFDGQAGEKEFQKLTQGKKVAFDMPAPGLPDDAEPLPGDFAQLRWSLTDQEIERYTEVGKASSQVMFATMKEIKPGMSESEIAGISSKNVFAQNARPWVILIAADDRIRKFRHPIPTDKKLDKIAMVVLCVEKFGLICSITRLISFEPLSDELEEKQQAVTKIDAGVAIESKPGKSLSEMFDTIKNLYSEVGFDQEYKLHHQGGPTGYLTRETVAAPGSSAKLVENQALAWNPSITGTKSEDTVILTAQGPKVITNEDPDWPMIDQEYKDVKMPKADILVRS